ncbi:MAG: glucosyltransferase domain-containing protein [Clostridia bacterium]|nr:glucosyltransferase domain-containing protein [Clostridia bacterium]
MKNKKLSICVPEEDKKSFILCLVSTFLFGLLAHAYGLLNNIFSHDSLNALYADENENLAKIAVGRFLVPVVRAFRGPVAIPWLIGITAMLFIAASVFLVLKIFDVKSKTAIVVISAFMVTNATVTALTATYVHELDVDMFALFLSCLAAYCWKKSEKITGLIPVVILTVLTAAIYQSYAQVTVTIIILSLVLKTVENTKIKDGFVKGAKGAVSVGVGVGIYFALNKIMCSVFKTDTLGRVDVTAEYEDSLVQRVYMIFKNIVIAYFTPTTVLSTILIAAVNGVIILGIVASVVMLWKKNGIKAGGKLFTLVLFAMLPVGMDFIALFNHEGVHDVMMYSFWFIYVFAVVLLFRYAEFSTKSVIKAVALILAGIVIWNNILVSNTAYLKKDMEREATLSLMTRVVDDLENRDDYIVGETEVAFSGYPEVNELYPGFRKVSHMIGLRFTMMTGSASYTPFFNGYDNFFTYYMNYPVNVSDTDYHEDSRVAAMPSFPEDGYIQNIDGVLVVKLGEKKLPSIGKSNLEEDIKALINIF